jgi:hypothetical protein
VTEPKDQEVVSREWFRRHLRLDGVGGDKPDAVTMAALVYMYGFQLPGDELVEFKRLVSRALGMLSGKQNAV